MAEDDDRPRVLIVEDEPGLAELYELWLADDYDVVVATSGDEALRALDASVQVVLLDRRMPGLSGDAVLDRIREEGVDCRVAMVSAVEPDFDVLEMGFDDYVSKPVNREELTETVERLVTLAEYDSDVMEFYALVSKQSALEAEKSAGELSESPQYAALTEEVEALREHLDAELEPLLESDAERLFQKLD